jgi:hypothetical protein
MNHVETREEHGANSVTHGQLGASSGRDPGAGRTQSCICTPRLTRPTPTLKVRSMSATGRAVSIRPCSGQFNRLRAATTGICVPRPGVRRFPMRR